MIIQPSFFDFEERREKLTEMGDPLVGLNALIDWEAFRGDLNSLHIKERKSNAGAKPIDVVLMFKVLILQQLHNLSDQKIEFQIRDRLSFMRFLGLELEHKVPDEKTIWLFRERLKEAKLVEVLFARFNEKLAEKGYVARSGQMLDATFIEVPRQRNTREENALIKADAVPEEWKPDDEKSKNKLEQKDVDARWTKKNDESHYGYKNHINADADTKLIQAYAVTHAAVHDSRVFEELLDQTTNEQGEKRTVFADSAYRSKEHEAHLVSNKIPSQIHEKGVRGTPLTDEQKASNRIKSKTRVRVEHIFGSQAQMGGHIVRTIGKCRAAVKIGLMNLVYNMRRLGQLMTRDCVRAARSEKCNDREVAPAA